MKILLTNPNFEGIVYTPSLGLGFMATYLKEHSDWDVEVIEPILERINEKEILNKVKGADILGLICYTESRFQVFDFARKAKEANPDCKIIVGGPHVFALDEAILEHYPFVDAVIKGEGEETVLDVVKGKPFGEILGLTWRKNSGEIIKNLDRLMIKDIDNLHYDYSLVFSELAGWKDFEISRTVKIKRFADYSFQGVSVSMRFLRCQSAMEPNVQIPQPGRISQKDAGINQPIQNTVFPFF